MNILWCIIV